MQILVHFGLGISGSHLDNFCGQSSRFLEFFKVALELFIGSVKALFPDLKSLLMGNNFSNKDSRITTKNYVFFFQFDPFQTRGHF